MNLPEHLVYLTDETPGIRRKKWGRGFRYFTPDHQTLADETHLSRIRKLTIPPIWRQVWISPLASGHLQCTGKDPKNRKQYIYHEDWVRYRQLEKFDKLVDFGHQLPFIRKEYMAGLDEANWSFKKVLSLILYILDHYYLRIGNKAYELRNNTYGLTTLRRKHMTFDEGTLKISYKSKSGKYRNVNIKNKKVTKLIREITELRGYEVFRYKLDGEFVTIDSSDVNKHIQDLAGSAFSAKYFRTWGASKNAIKYYDEALHEVNENPRLKFEPTLIKKVAKQMSNTVTVCRKYYIHPEVMDFLSTHFPKPLHSKLDLYNSKPSCMLNKEEQLLLDILT